MAIDKVISPGAQAQQTIATEKMHDEDPEPAGLSSVESHENGQISSNNGGMKRNIKSRHAQMLAVGGSIGTNLFIGVGQVLAIGGPGLLLLSFIIMAASVFGIVTAICEVGAFIPTAGNSMSALTTRYLSKSLGFALGWLYVYSFGMIVAYELTAICIIIDYWPNDIHYAVWVSVGFVFFLIINLSPVGLYGESEFWFAGIKVVMATGLLMLSLVLMCGGGPEHEALGYRYWNNPGATKEYIIDGAGGRFTAFLYIWVFSGFSFFFAPEQLILTSGEMHHPRKNLPTAARRFFFRLVFFYVLGAAAIGVICPSDAPGLVSGAGNANASPWVIAIQNAGIDILPAIINAGILTAALSAGNAYLYMASRSLYSLANVGDAPRIFTRCNKWGVPYYAVLACSCFGFFGFLVLDNEAGQVFNWIISITNTAGFTSWLVCCTLFIRFRKAVLMKGVTVPYHSRIQPYAAWACLVIFGFLLLMNGFTVFYPGRFTASGFLTAYIGIPVFLALWIGHKLTAGRKDPWYRKLEDFDMVTGLDEVEADAARWDDLEREMERTKGNSLLGKLRVLWG